MLAALKKYKLWIGIAAAALVGALAWNALAPFVSAPALSSGAPAGPAPGRELLSLLLELKALELNESLFSDPAFRSLRDMSQELAPQPAGRTNPFAPLGSD